MRRKNLKKKSYVENFFGKKKDYSNGKLMNPNLVFLNKLFGRKVKRLDRKILLPNYKFYSNFVNDFKLRKGKIATNIILKKNNFVITQPTYFVKKQFLEARVNTISFEKSYNINSIPIFIKRLKHFGINIDSYSMYHGVNYYSFYKSELELNDFKDNLKKDDNKNLIKFKSDFSNNYFFDFNYYFNYNIFLINSLEIYKILIYLHLNKINIKYT